MSNSPLKEIVQLNGLAKNEKVNFICSKLSKIGCEFQLQGFESPFGRGINIVVFKIVNALSPVTVLTSHYDGETFYDNNCGVILLSAVIGKICECKHNRNFVIVFTDQEEQYQQGSYFFLKNNSHLSIKLNINIDGFGIGENIYTTDCLPFEKASGFQTDSTCFRIKEIRSISLFSSFHTDVEQVGWHPINLVYDKYLEPAFFIDKFNISSYHNLLENLWKNFIIIC